MNDYKPIYLNGEKPKSKWTKKDFLDLFDKMATSFPVSVTRAELSKLPVECLRDTFLCRKRQVNNGYKDVALYVCDEYHLIRISSSQIARLIANHKKKKEQKEISKKAQVEIMCLCKFLEYPKEYKFDPKVKPCAKQEVGIIKGEWFYRKNGTKKSIHSKGFEVVEVIEED